MIQLPAVKRILLGGGELHPTYFKQLFDFLPNSRIWTAYGMTECASSITTVEVNVHTLPIATALGVPVGRPPIGIEIGIFMDGQLVDEPDSNTDSFRHSNTGLLTESCLFTTQKQILSNSRLKVVHE